MQNYSWSWDGERFYSRFSKISQKEPRGCFGWAFDFFIREVYFQSKKEAFWSQFRRLCPDWWVQFIKGLGFNGAYNNTDSLQVECFKFAFFPVIQKEIANIFIGHLRTSMLLDNVLFIKKELPFIGILNNSSSKICGFCQLKCLW